MADVEAEHEPGLRPDLVQQRRPPRHPGPLPGVPHQARPFQVGERERDGGLGEPWFAMHESTFEDRFAIRTISALDCTCGTASS